MIRGILIGLALFGLLIIGSCSLLGYGTMAVLDKAAEVAREERLNPDRQANAEAKEIVDRAFEESMGTEVSYDHKRDFSEATDEDYSDFGDPTTSIEDRSDSQGY